MQIPLKVFLLIYLKMLMWDSVGTILPNLISHGLLTPKQRDYLTHPLHMSAEKQQELCGILLRLNEKCVKKFLQSLSETGHYDPHKQLLNKIQCTLF